MILIIIFFFASDREETLEFARRHLGGYTAASGGDYGATKYMLGVVTKEYVRREAAAGKSRGECVGLGLAGFSLRLG